MPEGGLSLRAASLPCTGCGLHLTRPLFSLPCDDTGLSAQYAYLPADRRDVRQRAAFSRHGVRGGVPLGAVRRGRRLSHDAAADLSRHSVGGRCRHEFGADRCLLRLRGNRAIPAQQRRHQNGRRAAGGRRRGIGHRRQDGAHPARGGPVRFVRRARLRDVSRRHRHADADRKRERNSKSAEWRDARCAAAGPAFLDPQAAASRCGSAARSSTSARCRRC